MAVPRNLPEVVAGRVHYVYRLFDSTGRLLYIGCSSNVRVRFAGHKHSRPWWLDVAAIDLEEYPSHAAGAHAELEAIRAERPVWNVVRRHWRFDDQPDTEPTLKRRINRSVFDAATAGGWTPEGTAA